MRGTDKQQRKVRPHQSPAVTASPDRGKPSCEKLISVPDAENGLQILPDNVILKTMTGLAENLLHDCENLEDTK